MVNTKKEISVKITLENIHLKYCVEKSQPLLRLEELQDYHV